MLIKIADKGKRISGFGGLFLYEQLLKQLKLDVRLRDKLPINLINPRVSSSYDKFKSLMYGFISGAECLDDMDRFGSDSLFGELVPLNSSQTYGDYLRSFSTINVKELNRKLVDTSLLLRGLVQGKVQDFTLDIDSTFHEQYGRKMEGFSMNYEGRMGLDSIMAYDDMGFMYWMDVRDGSTFSSNGASEIIHEVFSKIPARRKHIRVNRYFRGDSAFCNKDVFHACFVEKVKFVVAMRENMYMQYIPRIYKWHKADKDIRFKDGRSCEIGETVAYSNLWHEPLRIVAIRARRDDNTMFDIDGYDYRVFVTNIGSHEQSAHKINKVLSQTWQRREFY